MDGMSRLCPECRIPLESLMFRDIELDGCQQCGGIWFDDGELKKVQKSSDQLVLQFLESRVKASSVVVPDNSGNWKICPNCNERLTPYIYQYTSNIELDECDECFGVWVQDGELAKISEYVDTTDDPAAHARKEIAAAVDSDIRLHGRSNRYRGKSIVAFWSIFGRSRTGQPI